MKYFLIAGEASGDLHAANLMHAIKEEDPDAVFQYYGGDRMQSEGGTLLVHYKTIAYMGIFPVLRHLPQILRGMKDCKAAIRQMRTPLNFSCFGKFTFRHVYRGKPATMVLKTISMMYGRKAEKSASWLKSHSEKATAGMSCKTPS